MKNGLIWIDSTIASSPPPVMKQKQVSSGKYLNALEK